MSADRSKANGSHDETQRSDDSDKPNKPGAKPRASRAGTRSVSTLNAEQLARKRANDREAQRAIRQRTKEHIERLEQRIKELSGEDNDDSEGDPAYEEARRRNSELEQELRRLQATLYASEERQSSPDTAYSDAGYSTPSQESGSYSSPWATQSLTAGISGYNPTSVAVPRQNTAWTAGNSQYAGYVQSGPNSTATTSSPYGSEYASETGSLPLQPDRIHSFSTNGPQQGQGIPFRGPAADYIWPTATNSPATVANVGTPQLAHQQTPATHVMNPAFPNQTAATPPWELPIKFTPPTSPSATLLNNVIQHLRNLRVEGVSGVALVDSSQPNLGPLLQQGHPNSVHPLTQTILEYVNTIPFRGFPEKIGSVISIYPVFQWLIANTYETYTSLPANLVPRTSQNTTPHPIWVSLIMYPLLRDEIIKSPDRYATPEMEYIYNASLTLNWPYQPQDAVEKVGDEWRATQTFSAYSRDVGNWGLGELFQRRYPELRDVCRFLEQG